MRQINLVEGKVVAPEGMKVGIPVHTSGKIQWLTSN